jgi:hypothetical protein
MLEGGDHLGVDNGVVRVIFILRPALGVSEPAEASGEKRGFGPIADQRVEG